MADRRRRVVVELYRAIDAADEGNCSRARGIVASLRFMRQNRDLKSEWIYANAYVTKSCRRGR